MSYSVECKECFTVQVYAIRTQIVLCLRLVCKALPLQFEKVGLCRMSNRTALHRSYNESKARFVLLWKGSERLPSLHYKTSLHSEKSSFTLEHVVNSQAFEMPVKTKDSLPYYTYLFLNVFIHPYSISNCTLRV